MRGLLALFVLTSILAAVSAQGNVIYCYYGAWAQWRQGIGKFTIQDINPKLCTHIAYGFIGLTAEGAIDPIGATDNFPAFQNLKLENPNVKLLMSMGGWNEGSEVFSQVTNSDSLRQTLVDNIYNFLTTNNLDGIDIDWEYPAQRGGQASDKQSYVQFLQDLRNKFGTNLILTAAVNAYVQSSGPISYDVPSMNEYLDFFNVMTYDYHGSWDQQTGLCSPLYPCPGDANVELNMNSSINAWIQAGATPSKVLTGLAFYGRSFTLANPSENGVGAPIAGAGAPGPLTESSGTLTYLEICRDLNAGWTSVWDTQALTPYAYDGNQWVGYDNVQSITDKCNFAKSMNLGGVMIWSIESDDAHNVCGGGYNPLLTAVYQTVTGKPVPPSPPPPTQSPYPPTQAPTSPPQPPRSSSNTDCTTSGYFTTASNCGEFYECVSNGSGGFSQYVFNCPSGLWFDPAEGACNYPAQVTGCSA